MVENTAGTAGSAPDFGAAADTVRQTATQARQAGVEAIGQAGDVAAEARDRGAALAGELKDKTLHAVETGKDSIADRLEDMAGAVYRSGAQLEGHGGDMLAHLIERGAAEMGVLAKTLRTNDLQALFRELGGFASRQPALFVGASIAAGFALTRVGRIAVSGATQADLPTMPGGESSEGPKQ